ADVRVQPSAWKRPAARSGPAEWKVGDRVLACWFDLFWYSGAVLAVDADTVNVVFDHGGFAVVPHDRVRAVELEEGDRVYCRWKGGPFYYAAEVVRQQGERLFVEYEDGREEWTSVRLIRVEGEGERPA